VQYSGEMRTASSLCMMPMISAVIKKGMERIHGRKTGCSSGEWRHSTRDAYFTHKQRRRKPLQTGGWWTLDHERVDPDLFIRQHDSD
jgi:hypothetical protein